MPAPRPPGPGANADVNTDVARLRALLLADLRAAGLRPGNPRLLLLAGLPGTGKSSFARRITAQHPFLTIESDRMRKTLFPRPQYDFAENRRLFNACHRLIDEFLGQGYPVIFDATNIRERDRIPVYNIAQKRGVPLAIVVITAHRATVRRRLQRRASGREPHTWSDANWQIYCRMAPHWEPVTRPHIAADTSGSIAAALRRTLAWAAGPGR